MFKKSFAQFYKKVIISILILVSIYFIGTAGYILIEDMSLLDALFMTTITITTVGYGVVKELSRVGTIFTIVLIVVGTGTVAYILVTLADFFLSEYLLDRFQIRRVSKMISKLNKHYIICGLGRVGYEIALELSKDKADFVVIDSADKPIEICRQNNWLYIQADASNDSTLIEAGVKKAKVLFAALDSESENVYITLSSKALNPEISVVARATEYETISKLERAGAARVVSPQIIGGRRMVALAKQPTVIDFIDSMLSTDQIELSLAEIEVKPGCRIDGMSIKDASEKYKFEALIISVIESGQKVLVNKASPNTIIKGGHKLIVVGTMSQIQQLSNLAVVGEA